MPVYPVDLLDSSGGKVPCVKVAASAREENLIAFGVEKRGCGEGGIFDVDGGEERIWGRMCGGSDVVQVKRRCRAGG